MTVKLSYLSASLAKWFKSKTLNVLESLAVHKAVTLKGGDSDSV